VKRFLFFIEGLSAQVGKAFGWCILVLTLGICYEVFVRYVLRDPTAWAFDFSYIMYGTLFMMAGAYTLARDAHVRGDVIYRLLPPRVQAGIEGVLYIVFFFPAILALIYAGYDFARESWSYMEVSSSSPANIPVYPLKTVIPLAGFFLLLQGIAEVVRCVQCLKHGAWPQRLHDVEETEVQAMLAREKELEREMHLDETGIEGGNK
jgi:TRAP-type mannitol/chloroaromatic compound transport system permease small subunit